MSANENLHSLLKKTLNIKVCVGFCRTTMKNMGKFRCSRISSLFRALIPKRGSSRILRNDGSNLLSRRDISIKLLSYNIFVILSKSNFFVISKLFFCLRSYLRLMVAPDELGRKV